MWLCWLESIPSPKRKALIKNNWWWGLEQPCSECTRSSISNAAASHCSQVGQAASHCRQVGQTKQVTPHIFHTALEQVFGRTYFGRFHPPRFSSRSPEAYACASSSKPASVICGALVVKPNVCMHVHSYNQAWVPLCNAMPCRVRTVNSRLWCSLAKHTWFNCRSISAIRLLQTSSCRSCAHLLAGVQLG